MTDALKSHYPKAYGQWTGNPKGIAPDYSRCCKAVHHDYSWAGPKQCQRKNGHGPDGAYCKQHDPDAVRQRHDEQARKWREASLAQDRRNALGHYGKRIIAALKAIEAGHNDPRGLAKETLDAMRSREWWSEDE